MSDDSFHYFRSWLIGKVQTVVALALSDPDALGRYIDDPEVENESREYVAVELLEEKGVEEDPRDASEVSADDEPTGVPFDEDAVTETFPRLAAR